MGIKTDMAKKGRCVGTAKFNLDTGRGLINFGRVAWKRMFVERPKTPNDTRTWMMCPSRASEDV